MTTFTDDRELLLEQIITVLTVNIKHQFDISWNSPKTNDSLTTNQYGSVIDLYRSAEENGPNLQINFRYNIFGLKLTLTWHSENKTESKEIYEKTILYMSLLDRFEDYKDSTEFEEALMELSSIFAKGIKDIHLILNDSVNYTEKDKESALREECENFSISIMQFVATRTDLASMGCRL